jgi:hypothetical protein
MTYYGMISERNIHDHFLMYHMTESRMAQNAVQMAHCLTNSTSKAAKVRLITSKAAKVRLLAESNKYIVHGVPCGPLQFTNTIKHTITDTRATSSHLHEQMTVLDLHMLAVDSNIELFNQHVKEIVVGLQTGEQLINWLSTFSRHTVLSVILSSCDTCTTREIIIPMGSHDCPNPHDHGVSQVPFSARGGGVECYVS